MHPGAIFFLSVAVTIGLMVGAMIWDYKSSEKAVAKRKAERQILLDQEMLKPKSYIEFRPQFVIGPVRTKLLNPHNHNPGSKNWYWIVTSQEKAEALLAESYKRGYFQDSDGITYPACSVGNAIIKTEGDNVSA